MSSTRRTRSSKRAQAVTFNADKRILLAEDIFESAHPGLADSDFDSDFEEDISSGDEYLPALETRAAARAKKVLEGQRQTRAAGRSAKSQIGSTTRPKVTSKSRSAAKAVVTAAPQSSNKNKRPKHPLPAHPPSSKAKAISLPSAHTAAAAAALPTSRNLSNSVGDEGTAPPKKRKRLSKHQQQRKRQKKRDHRKAQRAAIREASRAADKAVLRDCCRRHLAHAEPVLLPEVDIASIATAKGGWRGLARPEILREPSRSLAALKAGNVQVLDLDGKWDRPILDRHRRNFMLYRPADRSEKGQTRQAAQETALDKLALEGKWHNEGRGVFRSARDGHLHQGGTGGPTNCRQANQKDRRLLDEFFASPAWVEDAKLTDIAWQTFNPQMHRLYQHVRLAISAQFGDEVRWNFPTLPFSTTTINLGPQVVCFDHVDHEDFSKGWAVLKAFKGFDHKKGGHIVFWELGIAIEMPPGAEIWFPSALLVHSNTAIAEHETRYSVTSYSGAGLFQWVYRGGVWPCHWDSLLHPQKYKDAEDITPEEWERAFRMREVESAADKTRDEQYIDMCFPVWD